MTTLEYKSSKLLFGLTMVFKFFLQSLILLFCCFPTTPLFCYSLAFLFPHFITLCYIPILSISKFHPFCFANPLFHYSLVSLPYAWLLSLFKLVFPPSPLFLYVLEFNSTCKFFSIFFPPFFFVFLLVIIFI